MTRYFSLDFSASDTARLTGISVRSINNIFIKLRIRLAEEQACRYLVKDFGTSESPKSTRQRDSRYAPTVLRPPRFRIAHCSKAACALLHHDSRK
ncbi:MAG: hypothetical protein KZQ65_10140 [Candidatus Thiodiazotropha sp. (ex Gloverina cf. vestifex)]|nr:hypothetical protein [Candidatus Thiodiazotropha sp. (ex Gloverina cf. vestifex)]